MTESQPERVQGLTFEVNGRGGRNGGAIPPLTDERVPAYRCLYANLISTAGPELHFEQRRIAQILDDGVFADRVLSVRVVRPGGFLNERSRMPGEAIPPRSGSRFGMTLDDRQVDAFRFAPPELLDERPLRRSGPRKNDESRRVLIDPVHDEWTALAVRSIPLLERIEDRRRCGTAFERHGKQPRRLVDDDDRVVFVNDGDVARPPNAASAFRAVARVQADH